MNEYGRRWLRAEFNRRAALYDATAEVLRRRGDVEGAEQLEDAAAAYRDDALELDMSAPAPVRVAA